MRASLARVLLRLLDLRLARDLGARQRRRAQLVAGRTRAQLLARLRAVPGAEDVAQVDLVLERVEMVLVVANDTGTNRRLPADRGQIFDPIFGDVFRPRPVAQL